MFAQKFYIKKFFAPNQFIFATTPSANNERSPNTVLWWLGTTYDFTCKLQIFAPAASFPP